MRIRTFLTLRSARRLYHDLLQDGPKEIFSGPLIDEHDVRGIR